MLELALKATLIFVLAGLTASMLGRASAAVRHVVWLAALTSVLLLPIALLIAPAWHPAVPATLGVAVGPTRLIVDVLAAPAQDRWTVSQWAWGAWFLGALMLLGRAVAARIRVAGWVRRARATVGTGSIPVRISREVSVPLVCGIWKPVILMPEESRDWPADRLRIVLAHEAMHVTRRDTWAQALAQLVCGVYWPHPLVWLAAARLHRECEQACDDGVLALGEKASLYAEQLVEIVRGLAGPHPTPQGGIAMIHISGLERRLAALLNPNRNRRAAGRRPALIACAAAAAILLPLATLRTPAQTGATLVGVVQDPSGAVVPAARVTIMEEGSGRVESTSTSPAGDFSFRVPGGVYSLRVEAPGFKRHEQQNISVGGGSPVRVDANLELGRVQEAVTVRGERTPALPAATPNAPVRPTRIRVGGNVQPVRLISQAKPVYPPDCKAEGVEGSVRLRGVISRDGAFVNLQQMNIELVDARLIQAATDAVVQWRYQPTLLNGQPVEVITDIEINFTLEK